MKYELFGEDNVHLAVANNLVNLVNLYLDQEKFNDTMKNYEEALKMFFEIFGKRFPHPSVSNTLCNIGLTYAKQGNLTDAVKNLKYH